jgi:hypothetical protein
MSDNPTAPIGLRAAAIRMVAAAEYFKASGELPPWARAELESWNSPAAVNLERRSPLRPWPDVD